MLVQRPEFVQLPKGMVFVGVPSAVRLKLVEDGCHCGWKQATTIGMGRVLVEDGKLNEPFILHREPPNSFREPIKWGKFQVCELPRQLIEGRPETADKVAKSHRNGLRGDVHLNPADMEKILEIVVFPDAVRFVAKPERKLPLERIEVKLRPAGFHFYIDQFIQAGFRSQAAFLSGPR